MNSGKIIRYFYMIELKIAIIDYFFLGTKMIKTQRGWTFVKRPTSENSNQFDTDKSNK